MKKHLLGGVTKGAFSAEVAEQKFQSWMSQKDTKIEAEKENVVKSKEADKQQRLEAEAKVKEAKAQAIAKKLQDERKAAEQAAAVPEAETEAPAAE
jgi:small subunit ribosomal protein S16